MIKKYLFLWMILLSITCSGCFTTTQEKIEYQYPTSIDWIEKDKLSYLLQWVIDIENDEPDVWNKPLSTDEQKWRFIYNILNSNYMDKYEEEWIPEDPYYPVLEDSFIPNEGDVHDSVFPTNQDVKVAYKKSDIDTIMKESFWDTLKDWEKIMQEWLILSWDNYLLFTYSYYWSDLIANKGRSTNFTIDSINQASDKDIEVTATYYDDILEEWDNGDIKTCDLTYHIAKNPNSFFWYTVNEYKYSWCEINKDYIPVDLPSQMIYGFFYWIYSDYVTLNRDYETRELNIDVNNDWIDEYFKIGPDSPNWSIMLWVYWDKGYNFFNDFTHQVLDENNDIIDWLFAEIYVEDINWDDVKEVLAVVWDKKTRVEANIYSFDAWFKKVSTITGRSYLEYDEESDIIHAPYSNHWECVQYAIEELL